MGSHAWKLGGLILVVLLLWGCNEAPPQAKNGVMDLRSWDFQTQGPLSLNGDWDFYWEELISPLQFVAGAPVPRSGFYRFPGCWNGKKVGEKSLAGMGYATFRLKVLLPQDETPKAIRILNLSSAYRLWIDGKEVAKNGVVGTSRETSRGQYYLQEKGFTHTSAQLDLVLQVANFEHRKGGIWHSIDLGHASDIFYESRVQWVFDLTLFGALLVMALYHFSFFWFRREEPSSIYFSFFCLVLALRALVSGNFYLTQLFPHCPLRLLYCLELISVVLPMPFLLAFFCRLYPGTIHRAWVGIMLALSMAMSLAIVALPTSLASLLAVPNQAMIFFILGLILVVLFKALRGGMAGARTLLAGVLFFGVAATVDILIVHFHFHIKQLVPSGVFGLILCQSFVLSQRYALAYAALKENVQLRREVEARKAAEVEQKMIEVRLSRVLDTMDDAIVAVDENRTIVFCNRQMAHLTGEDPHQLVGTPALDLVADEMRGEMKERLESIFDQDSSESVAPIPRDLTVIHREKGLQRVKAEAVPLRIEDEPLLVARLYDGLEHGPLGRSASRKGSELLFLSELAKNRARLQAMEDVISVRGSGSQPCDVTTELRSIDTALKQMEGVLLSGGEEGEKRRLGAEVMIAALACWEAATGLGRVELARRSKLWKIHTNQNGFERTQTLDRYLEFSRFPKKPRWNQIYQTAEFVLLSCRESSSEHIELETLFARLKLTP